MIACICEVEGCVNLYGDILEWTKIFKLFGGNKPIREKKAVVSPTSPNSSYVGFIPDPDQ